MSEPVTPEVNDSRVWRAAVEPTPQSATRARWARLVRFGIAGVCATLFYFVVTNALHYLLGATPVLASVLGYCVSVVLSYLLQSRFTFQTKNDSPQQVGRFIAATVIGLAASWGLVYLASNILGQPTWVGTLVVCVAIPVLNYVLFHLWVFVRLDERADL